MTVGRTYSDQATTDPTHSQPTDTSELIRFLLFSFFLFSRFLIAVSVLWINLAHVSCRLHVEVASRIVSYRIASLGFMVTSKQTDRQTGRPRYAAGNSRPHARRCGVMACTTIQPTACTAIAIVARWPLENNLNVRLATFRISKFCYFTLYSRRHVIGDLRRPASA